MQQFFETNDSKFVNLREVTSIAFEDQKNKYGRRYKIIFNMNYGVSLKDNPFKQISDYVYSVYDNRTDFMADFEYLMNLVDEYQWIKAKEPRIVNPDHISFVTQDYRKNRIIINLASSVSFHGNTETKTSDFIYINCDDEKEFAERLINIQDALTNLIL